MLILCRGAYIAALLITLLDLPQELSQESPAQTREGGTLLQGLPEWVAQCKRSCILPVGRPLTGNRSDL